ncbi:DMT family transporter [Nonlabens antarcticus]|uniref:DMT family transporter n=1 Tax=Nonlabens antarcticus TaxID=392714 RepID=UPI001891755F|nr:DMT family transporter [Nonlabens antarcticus]
MIWLILSIVTSSLLYVIFKYFSIFRVNTLHAIIVNYLIASITGFIAYQGTVQTSEIVSSPWIWYSIILGALFICVFNVVALTSQINGVSVAAVASKMSLVIPVTFGIWLYEESLDWLKIIGIILALISVYLVTIKSKQELPLVKSYFILPVLLFIGSGTIDTVIKYAEKLHVPSGDEALFSAICFSMAFGIGLLVLIYEAIQGRFLQWKSVIAGVVLGIPNYFSIYFIIKSLKTDMESSVVFPINHVGTVLFAALLGVLIFKERLLPQNYWGILLAVMAIVCIAFAKASFP